MQQEALKQDMIFGLEDKPNIPTAIFAALQHLLAIFIGIVTPPIIICGALGFDLATKAFIINMALFASGISTLIQARRIGPIGSGLLSIQGTSFTFLGTVLAIGFAVKNDGGSTNDILATIFGTCFVCASVEIVFSRFIKFLRTFITPLVSGIVVTLIGLSLIRVGITDMGGGQWLMDNKPEFYATGANLAMAFSVLAIIIIFNRSKKPMVRLSSVFIGLAVGYIIAIAMGKVNTGSLKDLSIVSAPIPFKFGFFKIHWGYVIPMALLYLITTVESIGDLTATSMISGEPIEGDVYMKRISGGVLGDGVNSALAAVFNSFPNTTFSQNNGVIQLTGVASRYVAYFIAGLLMLFGLFPIVGGIFSIIPLPVLGGATIIMFATVAASGIRIIATSGVNGINRRGIMIMAISFGLGLGVVVNPMILQNLPPFVKQVFSSGITTGGLTAIILNIVLPKAAPLKTA
ncbi:MAG: xanthine permease XanP [Spirochaeta sp. LUC14_002_19_P3]|nr:MAG: xanthine permease XanP [Spirochaeta sp. LUC14_002_19_P3]